MCLMSFALDTAASASAVQCGLHIFSDSVCMCCAAQGECIVLDAFMSESFVAKLIGYFSLEEKKGSDHFNKSRMTVFVVRHSTYMYM